MIGGIKKRFNSESAATTSVGSLFQMSAAATAKARLPTADSFTCGTTRRLVLEEGVVVVLASRRRGPADQVNVVRRHAELSTPE